MKTYGLSFRTDPVFTKVMLFDTSVVIDLWERSSAAPSRALNTTPFLSVFSWIELEGGVHKEAAFAASRSHRLSLLLDSMRVVPFDEAIIPIYGRIIATRGFSRRKILDRLIAATAILHDLTLVTLNEADFADIPGLRLEVWPSQ